MSQEGPEQLLDLNDRPIQVGDRVAFATRIADFACLKVGEVLALKPAAHERDDKIVVQVPGQERPSTVAVRASWLGAKVVVL